MTPDNFPTGTGGGGGDTQAPTAPSAVRSTGTTSSSVSLAWTASSDAVGVTGYDVYRGTTRVGTATGTSFTDTGLAASTAYSYTVRARDAAGNVSAASAPVSVTTGAGTTPPPPPPGGVKVQYRNTGTSATDNQANLAVQLVNTGTTTRNLTGTSLRYYFTRDGGTSFTVACDWAQIGCANLQNRVVPLATPVAGADAYVETTFTAGSVAAGASTGEIQLRFHRNDWQNLNETNDHSRGTNTAPADSTRITAHSGGTLLWGTPPA
ncbi:cellulose binding domain-containing protein [Kineococcus sp. NUM-3379]